MGKHHTYCGNASIRICCLVQQKYQNRDYRSLPGQFNRNYINSCISIKCVKGLIARDKEPSLMKKCISYILSLVCILSLVACSDQNVEPTKTTPTTITPTDVPAITEVPISSSLPEKANSKQKWISINDLLQHKKTTLG